MSSDNTDISYDPADHYDRVMEAWALLLGAELHYGVFDSPDQPLVPATAQLTNLMIEGAQLEAGLRLLDVGCGSGAQACQLVEDFDIEVLGITTSQVGIDESTARAKSRGITGATFELRDATANGLPDNSFDRVWALESSHLMPNREAFVAEAARVLRPGGRFVMCDVVRLRDIPFAELRERRDEFALLRAAYGSARMEPIEFYADQARANGLVVDQVIDLSEPTYPTFQRWRENLELHREAVTPALGEQGVDEFDRSLAVLEGLWSENTLGYALLSASAPA
ncbi:27-O-demethylrifamycin SV methyltransferase [Aeromicrobium panaciterrae]|uniref:27-O-demethylrifamycin SV methyltransferase n=1 Tax=Aeromicrobium panaciterrae TaxID=363861 RepID=A0ABU1UKN0_9ACTN|nr:class I SAM-dependent methyltransferase [Aeromicrobium panaciterrae]MDR7085714.1 27-O-demethylrifamycin SV methyltransferase [Aeromicrobium panaciterrae]